MSDNITIAPSLVGKVIVERRGAFDGAVCYSVRSNQQFLMRLSIDGQTIPQPALESSPPYQWASVLYLRTQDSAEIVEPEQYQ